MIDQQDKNRLETEKNCLLDEVAEEMRLANLTPQKAQFIIDFAEEQHAESERLVKEGKATIDEVITTYRGLVRMLMHTVDVSYID